LKAPALLQTINLKACKNNTNKIQKQIIKTMESKTTKTTEAVGDDKNNIITLST